MKNSGVKNIPFSFGNIANVSEDEMTVIEEYAEEIEKSFEE